MSDTRTGWKAEHALDIAEKHAHISQKLAQLARIKAAIEEMRENLSRQYEWLHSLQTGEDGNVRLDMDYLDPEIYVRLMSVGAALDASFGSVLNPGAGGSGPPPATGSAAAGIYDAVGPLGTQVNVSGFVAEFGMTGSIDGDAEWGDFAPWAADQMLAWFSSPFEQYQRTKFTWRAQDLMEDLRQNHGDDFEELAKAHRDALSALTELGNALNGADLSADSVLGGRGAADLEAVLDMYNDAYDGASGTGPPSSAYAEAAAQQGSGDGPPGLTPDGADLPPPERRTFSSFEEEVEYREQQTAGIDFSADNDYDPSTDPDLLGMDSLPPP
ncbi:MAG: hypothetical protein R8F63_00940 [Acidimicrobiales bacterium]|nr:hypothetical protein [Acidimicrobiales bacterium]